MRLPDDDCRLLEEGYAARRPQVALTPDLTAVLSDGILYDVSPMRRNLPGRQYKLERKVFNVPPQQRGQVYNTGTGAVQQIDPSRGNGASRQEHVRSGASDGGREAEAPPLMRRMSSVSRSRIEVLDDLDKRLEKYEAKIPGFQSAVKTGRANPSQLGVIKGELGQLYGDLEKLQYNEIDAVVTGDLQSGREDAKALRKNLTRRTAKLLDTVKELVDEVKRKQLG